jgi:hypothetical protein
MADTSDVTSSPARPRHYLLHPSTLVLVAADLVPLAGVVFWRWDAFLLLSLYWMETVIIALWNLARLLPIAMAEDGPAFLENARILSGAAGAHFVMLALYFKTLWVFAGGAWAVRIHGPDQFVRLIIVNSGLWVPLAGFTFSRGVFFLFHVARPDLLQRIERKLFPGRPIRPPLPPPSLGEEAAALLVRMVVPPLSIGFAGLLSLLLLGEYVAGFAFMLVILVKTALDVWLYLTFDLHVYRLPMTLAK